MLFNRKAMCSSASSKRTSRTDKSETYKQDATADNGPFLSTERRKLLLILLLLLCLLKNLFSRTTWVSWYQKGKTSLDLNEARDDGVLMMGWQLHQLDHMQTICTSLQTDNHTNTSSLSLYRPDALPDTQPTVSKHRRQKHKKSLKDHKKN